MLCFLFPKTASSVVFALPCSKGYLEPFVQRLTIGAIPLSLYLPRTMKGRCLFRPKYPSE